jgi:amino acid transporter
MMKIELYILQGIGMAIITILIPVAIAIFRERKEFEILDRNVILDHVVKARRILVYLALIFLPLLFWNISNPWLRFLELIIWGIGVYFMVKVLINSYHWIKGNKFILRFDYLRNLRNLKDIEESWRSVWETQNINTQNEGKFFEMFSSVIDQLLKL